MGSRVQDTLVPTTVDPVREIDLELQRYLDVSTLIGNQESGQGRECSSRVIVVGSLCIGKTSLLNRILSKKFAEDYRGTIGLDCKKLRYKILDAPISLELWDTAGDERFRAVSRSYYRNADACLLCYDVGNRQSFLDIDQWYQEVLQYVENKNVLLYLVGCKSDLMKEVHEREVLALAERLGGDQGALFHLAVSAKYDTNVRFLFDKLAVDLFSRELLEAREEETGGATRHRPSQVTVGGRQIVDLSTPGTSEGPSRGRGGGSGKKKCGC